MRNIRAFADESVSKLPYIGRALDKSDAQIAWDS